MEVCWNCIESFFFYQWQIFLIKLSSQRVYKIFTRIFILKNIANKFQSKKKRKRGKFCFSIIKRIYECAIFNMVLWKKGYFVKWKNQIHSFMLNPTKSTHLHWFQLNVPSSFMLQIIHESFRLIYTLLIIQWRLFLYLPIFFLQIDTFFCHDQKSIHECYSLM